MSQTQPTTLHGHETVIRQQCVSTRPVWHGLSTQLTVSALGR